MYCSEQYRKSQEKLHAKGNYGVTGHKYGAMVGKIMDEQGLDTILDYGCGSNLSLTQTLKPKHSITYTGYDIGVPEYADAPDPAEMVCCIDVLEHIEPEFLDAVLDHLEDLTEVTLFASVHMGPAGKVLDDGRNAHLTQQPLSWWFPKFSERFNVQTAQLVSPVEFFIIANNLALDLA